MKKTGKQITVRSYAERAIPHLERCMETNARVLAKLSQRLVKDVKAGKSLLVFGSGHSALFPMELYHRAGGASFVLPLVADYLLPTAGPPVVRLLERTPGTANYLLNRAQPLKGEMLWVASQSGINAAVVDLALEAKSRGLFTAAFTSRLHSASVRSRHASGKRLYEVCDEVVDLGGVPGDASVEVADGVFAGPLSTLGMLLLGHSIIVSAAAALERSGRRSVYTSVNTEAGEARNRDLERKAAKRDVLLR